MRKALPTFLVIGASLSLTPALQAQFHSKTQNGGSAVNPQAIQQAQQQQLNGIQSQTGQSQVGMNDNSTIYMSDAQKKAFAQWNPRMGAMQGKSIHIWGRAIHHEDDTYTESKQDNTTNTLKQETKSKNGTLLQRRMVTLDANGQPSEVMIYDGRNQFKYRGTQVYDQLGRFSEEQLYDAKGTLIRRKVQEYAANGNKMPLRSWDYVENVPEDLKLVITRETEDPTRVAETAPEPEKRGLFNNQRQAQQPQTQQQPPAQQAASSQEQPRKGLKLGRLFGRKE